MLDFLQTILPSFNSGHGNDAELKKREFEFEFESSPLLQNKEFKEKSGSKLKVVMRKKAAFRLLSKCKNEGRLECEDDVANDLKTISAGYDRLLSYNAKHQ